MTRAKHRSKGPRDIFREENIWASVEDEDAWWSDRIERYPVFVENPLKARKKKH